MKKLFVLLSIFVLLIFSSCSSVPPTGDTSVAPSVTESSDPDQGKDENLTQGPSLPGIVDSDYRPHIINATENPDKVDLRARVSRYAADFGSCFEQPITRFSQGVPGHGIRKNPDTVVPLTEGLFAFPASEGGEAYYSLFFKGVKSFDQIKLSVSGCYAPSRESITRKWEPAWLESGAAVPQYPDGFPMAEFFELPDPKDYPPPTV